MNLADSFRKATGAASFETGLSIAEILYNNSPFPLQRHGKDPILINEFEFVACTNKALVLRLVSQNPAIIVKMTFHHNYFDINESKLSKVIPENLIVKYLEPDQLVYYSSALDSREVRFSISFMESFQKDLSRHTREATAFTSYECLIRSTAKSHQAVVEYHNSDHAHADVCAANIGLNDDQNGDIEGFAVVLFLKIICLDARPWRYFVSRRSVYGF
jgi:hypothetical protein